MKVTRYVSEGADERSKVGGSGANHCHIQFVFVVWERAAGEDLPPVGPLEDGESAAGLGVAGVESGDGLGDRWRQPPLYM